MRVFVTGGGGFVGRHLARELAAGGHEPVVFDIAYKSPVEGATNSLTGNICDANALKTAIEQSAPDACVHLGGIAFSPEGDRRPNLMLEVNTGGTVNLLEAFRQVAPRARILVVSTAHVYALQKTETPITEDAQLAPVGMYPISKSAADLTALAYANRFDMITMVARPNNHTGPGQSPNFVVASFAQQVKAMATGSQEPRIDVGNLDCCRDFTDVRDVVRAYRLLLEKGQAGQAYNIARGQQVRIGDVLDELCELAGVSPEICVDPERFRPTNSSPNLSTQRILEQTGWKPRMALTQTLRDMLQEL